MPLSTNEAAETLRDIDRTSRRSANAYGYSSASPHLTIWGFVWAVGYSVSYVRPQWSGVAWLALIVIGTIASFTAGARMRPVTARFDWRYGATLVAVLLFITALFSVIPPKSSNQVAAFFPVLMSLFYALVGIWTKGMRLIVLAVALCVLTLLGYFELPAQFPIWMAAIGGGGLILGGVWLRSV